VLERGMNPSKAFAALTFTLLLAGPTLAQDLPPTTVRTGFDPQVDGLSFENSGDFESPDGNCFGMSCLAIAHFLQRRSAGTTAPAPAPAHSARVRTEAAPVEEEELVSYVQQNTSQNPLKEAKLADPKNVLAALVRMAKTGEPEIFTMTGSQGGHANVIFGYENGAVLLLDPNYPHKTLRWPFDFKKGFGPHPFAKSLGAGKDFYAVLKTAGATPFTKFKASREIATLSDPAKLDKASLARYPDTTVTASPDKITGTVTGGPKKDEDGNKALKPTRAWLTVDDKPVSYANVQADGSFNLKVPKGAVTKDSKVRVVITVDEKDQDARNKEEDFHMFAGFVAVDTAKLVVSRGLTSGLDRVR
jgi:hypothetical protein